MTDSPPEEDRESLEAENDQFDAIETAAVTSPYKVLGELTAADGVGVLGQNNAGSGTPIGVQGAVPNASAGYGLSTPDDARVSGVLEVTDVTSNPSEFTLTTGDTGIAHAMNVVLGHETNAITDAAAGGVIGGGGFDDGATDHSNQAYDNYATIGGGRNNQAGTDNEDATTDPYPTVGGGRDNTANGPRSTVGGGMNNTASAVNATVGGGRNNVASHGATTVGGGFGNTATGRRSTIGGGINNATSGNETVIGGGDGNVAGGANAVVAGGIGNTASAKAAAIGGGTDNDAGGWRATVGGGLGNTADSSNATVAGGTSNVATGIEATVGGGNGNAASDNQATVSGGEGNLASSDWATVGGGDSNVASSASWPTVAGGRGNSAVQTLATVGGGDVNTASGLSSTVPGGKNNLAEGDESFAAGSRAKAENDNAFVWNDGTFFHDIDGDGDNDGFSSADDVDGSGVTGANTFHASADGGFRFVTGSTTVAYLSSGSATWSSTSSRSSKTNVDPVDPATVLAGVEEMDVATWEYRDHDGEGQGVRHIGPMAEDFHEVVDVGNSDEHINSLNADGVLFAAVKGLARELDEKDERIEELEAEVERVRTERAVVDERLSALEEQAGRSAASADD